MEVTVPPTYGYGIDCERFYGHLPTREEAIAQARREYPDADVIYTCKGTPIDLADHAPDGAWIIEHIQGNADIADVLDVLNVSRADEDRLTEAIRKTVREWLSSVNEDQYYTAEDVERHVVREEAEAQTK